MFLYAARRAAEEALLDGAWTLVSEQAYQYQELLARLDVPPKPNARLRKTLGTPAPWDKTQRCRPIVLPPE
jgi:uncharacterized protein (DUF1778 family)